MAALPVTWPRFEPRSSAPVRSLIENQRVGGTCLNIGCIPTKALTTSTELLLKARRAHEFGVAIPTAAPDLPALMAYKQGSVDALVGGVEHLLKRAGVTLLRGTGHLVGADTLRVQPDTGDAISVSASQVILAPGSITARPPIPGLDLPGVITSTEALDISDVPARLVVVGGGVIGLEFACIYEALGSQVTILEMMPTLLPGATDEGLAQRLALLLRRRGMSIVTGARSRRSRPLEAAWRRRIVTRRALRARSRAIASWSPPDAGRTPRVSASPRSACR